MWFYKNQPFDDNDIDKHVGFVYIITNINNGRKYIGQKLFWSKITRPPLKGKKKKRRQKIQSNWKEYYGSCEELKNDVLNMGPECFHREILYLCEKKAHMNYIEMLLQMRYNVLLDGMFYNSFVGNKIHKLHVQDLKIENHKNDRHDGADTVSVDRRQLSFLF